MTIHLMRMNMSVVFARRPGDLLKVKKSNPGWAVAAAARMISAGPAGVAAGGAVLCGVLLAAVALVLVYRSKIMKQNVEADARGSRETLEAVESAPSSPDAEDDSSDNGSESPKKDASKEEVNQEDGKGEDQDGDEKQEMDEKEKTSEEEDPGKKQEEGTWSKVPSLW